MRRLLTLLALTAACGSSTDEHAPAQAPAVDPSTVSLTADPMGRTEVARVNGAPVYADCVERQAEAHDLTVQAALDECIDFELLAQAADAAGLRTHPEVLEARKTEAARALIDTAFADQFDGPEDIPEDQVRATYDKLKERFWVYEEHRDMTYFRYKVPRDAAPGSPEDVRAKFLAHLLYVQLAGRRDVSDVELFERGKAIEASPDLAESPGVPSWWARKEMTPLYQRILFDELQEPGQMSPPTRTQWGWDIILLVKIWPERNMSFEEAAPEVREKMFEGARQQAFRAFVNRLLPGPPETSDYWLQRMAAADRANAALLRGGGG